MIYVRARKPAMGWPAGEVFVPQAHAPGAEAEVDWGQAQVELAGTATRVHLFLMRASFSGATFCQASLVETQQAFLELHAQASGWWRARPAPPSRGAGRGAGLLRQRRPGCGRLRRGASDARMGRAASVRRRAMGFRFAPASLERQQRHTGCSYPCKAAVDVPAGTPAGSLSQCARGSSLNPRACSSSRAGAQELAAARSRAREGGRRVMSRLSPPHRAFHRAGVADTRHRLHRERRPYAGGVPERGFPIREPVAHLAHRGSSVPDEVVGDQASLPRRRDHSAAIFRLVGAILIDMHDEWIASDRRHVSEGFMAKLHDTSDDGDLAAIGSGE